MLFEILSDIVKINDILLIVKNQGAVSEVRSDSLSIRQKDNWITIGDNDGPAHMHINSDAIARAEFVTEEKPERTSYSVRFFDNDNERVLGAFFTKMYDDKDLRKDRVALYEGLRKKFGSVIQF